MLRNTLKFLNHNKRNILALFLIALLIVTVMVFTFRTKETKDPNENKVLQIGLVNEDSGSTFNNKKYNFGTDFVNLLTQDHSASWYSVSRGVAESGIKHKNYDLIVILPQNFSKKILNFESTDFEKIDVLYKIRENKNPNLRTKITQINNSILNQLNHKVSEMYIASILFNLHQSQNHLNEINNSEKNLSSQLKGMINSPLTDFIQQYTSNANQRSEAGKQNQNDFSNNLADNFLKDSGEPDDLEGFLPKTKLDTGIDRINDSVFDASQKANDQLNSIASEGNSLVQENNEDYLNASYDQFAMIKDFLKDEGSNVSQLQDAKIQKQISDLFNAAIWQNETQSSREILSSLNNQKLQLSVARAKVDDYLNNLPSTTNVFNTYQNINNQGLSSIKKTFDNLVSSSITQLPKNSLSILNEMKSNGYLKSDQIDKFNYQLNLINQFYPDLTFDGDILPLETDSSDDQEKISFKIPPNKIIKLKISSEKVDLNDLYSQILNKGISSVSIDANQINIDNSAIEREISILPKLKSDDSDVEYSVILENRVLEKGKISSKSFKNFKDRETNYLNFISKLEQASALVSAVHDSSVTRDLNQHESVSQTSTYQTEKEPTDNNSEQLLLSLRININSAYDSIEDLENQYQEQLKDKEKASSDFQSLVLQIQGIYKDELDDYRNHLGAIKPNIELNTNLISISNPIDLSHISDIANSNDDSINRYDSQMKEAFRNIIDHSHDKTQSLKSRSKQSLQGLLNQSQDLKRNLDSQINSASGIESNSKEFVKNGKKILGESDSLLKNWEKVVKKNDEYNRNFGNSMGNTRNDDNSARKIYGNLANPLQFKNTGTIRNVSSIFPYFLTLVNIIVAGFSAVLIVNNDSLKFKFKLKRREGDELIEDDRNSLYQQYVIIVVIMFSFILALVSWQTVSGYLDKIIWLLLETLIQASLIEITIILVKFFRSIGRFIFVFFFIEYIFYTPALGLFLTKSSLVETLLKFASPFQQIEDIYSRIFANTSDNVLVIIIFSIILVITMIFNLLFKGRPNEKEAIS
ncbi:type VII secretion protein EsaA [Xylocopilactobacillus apicola]|uniref:Type VII secretion system accessory factor EsaA n=2 Tax=Xylocopilactobacillus apicola TaxID=2932184 RepID=A0AAU9DYZ7_9LACO|nr:type VII secretion protein EsaA [Xylocopilactobacillus apicola]